MKLLITGIPGTGKTSIGNYLASVKGYEHLDIEAALKRHDAVGAKIIKDFMDSPAENKVITWGFIPITDDAGVQQLLDVGYKLIWFDGNREAARREFLKRGDVPVEALDNQMAKIEKFDVEKFKPIYINTFSEDGMFLEKEAIAELIFEKMNIESQSLKLAKSFPGAMVP